MIRVDLSWRVVMIVKELDPLASNDTFARAGRVAEEQMAHYLRRAFATDEEIAVFSGGTI
jgi:hypothetical protein